MLNVVKNYHTHTKRCGHAIGSDEQYVIEAINSGIKVLGFSDHIFFKDLNQPGIRGSYDMLNDYVDSLNGLKEKYKDKIEIHIGFEAEAIEEFFDYYKNLLDSGKIEYLILGNHFNYVNNQIESFANGNREYLFKRYVDMVLKGMESGLFAYVAHPDLALLFYPEYDEFASKQLNRIIDASIRLDIPLEYNMCRVRTGLQNIAGELRYSYPYTGFFKDAISKGAKIIVGLDIHNPKHFKDPLNKQGLEILESLNPLIVDDIKLYR